MRANSKNTFAPVKPNNIKKSLHLTVNRIISLRFRHFFEDGIKTLP